MKAIRLAIDLPFANSVKVRRIRLRIVLVSYRAHTRESR